MWWCRATMGTKVKEREGPEAQRGLPPTFAKMEPGSGLGLSRETRTGLKAMKYISPTAVQKRVLPAALAGRDVLCAAKTGSGKTLAFVVPVLEKLTEEKWSARVDGIGALILTPTRELALQIFEELRGVGKKHRFSCGLLIGGGGRKALEEEKSRAGALNILIATPGRLLQHMDETPYFDCNALKILVLDEADRILDKGFRATLDAILENLPRGSRGGDGRQTLLFSATQTKSIKDLARLNLSDPEYISIHEEASMPTPVKLQQAFVECPSSQKISVLWGFIKTHLKAKVLVFFSTCKQARFVSDAFSKLRPWESWTEGPQATTSDTTCVVPKALIHCPQRRPRRPIAVPLLRARSPRPRPRRSSGCSLRSWPHPSHRAAAGDDTGQGHGQACRRCWCWCY